MPDNKSMLFKAGTVVTVWYGRTAVEYKYLYFEAISKYPHDTYLAYTWRVNGDANWLPEQERAAELGSAAVENKGTYEWYPRNIVYSTLSNDQMAAVVSQWPHKFEGQDSILEDRRWGSPATSSLPAFAQVGKQQPL